MQTLWFEGCEWLWEVGDGEKGEEENGADLIPRCQSWSGGQEAKNCEQEGLTLHSYPADEEGAFINVWEEVGGKSPSGPASCAGLSPSDVWKDKALPSWHKVG